VCAHARVCVCVCVRTHVARMCVYMYMPHAADLTYFSVSWPIWKTSGEAWTEAILLAVEDRVKCLVLRSVDALFNIVQAKQLSWPPLGIWPQSLILKPSDGRRIRFGDHRYVAEIPSRTFDPATIRVDQFKSSSLIESSQVRQRLLTYQKKCAAKACSRKNLHTL